jgi:hypothetical protein
VPLLRVPFEDWYCPNGCGVAERVPPLQPGASRFHTCARLHMLTAPLVRVGSDCVNEAVEREDYLNGDKQATGDDGKAYMAVVTKHSDGHTDRAVNAGLATARIVVLWPGQLVPYSSRRC